jgi:hypothetical protein
MIGCGKPEINSKTGNVSICCGDTLDERINPETGQIEFLCYYCQECKDKYDKKIIRRIPIKCYLDDDFRENYFKHIERMVIEKEKSAQELIDEVNLNYKGGKTK